MKNEILKSQRLLWLRYWSAMILIAALFVFSTGCNDDDDSGNPINEDFMNEMEAARMKMMEDMNAVPMTMDPDVDFAQMMIPHHQGAIDMGNIVLKYGEHEDLLMLAQQTVDENKASQTRLNDFIEAHGEPAPQEGTGFEEEMDMVMMIMDEVMKAMHYTRDPDYDFAEMMIHHHQSAIDMAKIELTYGKDDMARTEARKIIDGQQTEIVELAQFRNGHGQPE